MTLLPVMKLVPFLKFKTKILIVKYDTFACYGINANHKILIKYPGDND